MAVLRLTSEHRMGDERAGLVQMSSAGAAGLLSDAVPGRV
jgi:hypothetical protein